jgi:hypothetical protein
VQGDQLGDASGALAALDLDHEMIVHAGESAMKAATSVFTPKS